MRDYRAYILGIDGHRFIKASQFSSDHRDDAAAMEAAKLLLDGYEVEVWDCSRLVAQFLPDGKSWSPGLAPSLVFAAPSEQEVATSPLTPVSLKRVSELAQASSTKGNLFL